MKFILTVPDNEGVTLCELCPWKANVDVCQYCDDNNLCRKYNFAKTKIKELYESKN